VLAANGSKLDWAPDFIAANDWATGSTVGATAGEVGRRNTSADVGIAFVGPTALSAVLRDNEANASLTSASDSDNDGVVGEASGATGG
jgi:hypothetical protein